jgi:hypothetical protein
MNAQHTADNVLIDLHTESQRDLLSNAGTIPAINKKIEIVGIHAYNR